MSNRMLRFREALRDFQQARQQAALQIVLARMTGKSSDLISYNEVVHKLRLSARSESGVQSIPINAIVGSVDRYADFTRTFLPRQDSDRERWARVRTALTNPEGPALPPIDVYQIGQVYFVLDGNHRVSAARQIGMEFIEANVIRIHTDIPLTPDIQPDDLIVKAEYAEFLEQTHLTELRPNVDLSVTGAGQYDKLREQILFHQQRLQEKSKAPISDEQAVEDWYDEVYTPVAGAINEQGLLHWFPNRTETDLYLWVAEHQAALERELGWSVRPDAAVTDLSSKSSAGAETQQTAPGRWSKTRLMDRYLDRLFPDILVPLDGTPDCWRTLEQALVIARYEQSQLHGLYVVPSAQNKTSSAAADLRDRFMRTCEDAQVAGNFTIDVGNVAKKICERALLTDLVVLNLAHPPAAGWTSLGSGWHTLLRRSARPILAVPTQATPLMHALVAFDGSPQSKQALFVATYLAEKWRTQLVIVTVPSGTKVNSSVQDYAREYLELHEIQAVYVVAQGPFEILIEVARSREVDLVLMGGYSTSGLEQMIAGSTVDSMLRQSNCPLFICR